MTLKTKHARALAAARGHQFITAYDELLCTAIVLQGGLVDGMSEDVDQSVQDFEAGVEQGLERALDMLRHLVRDGGLL